MLTALSLFEESFCDFAPLCIRHDPRHSSNHTAQCCNHHRQNVHDSHGKERDSDRYQPRENVILHVRQQFCTFRVCVMVASTVEHTGPGRSRPLIHPGDLPVRS
jgi:hypothetical protein